MIWVLNHLQYYNIHNRSSLFEHYCRQSWRKNIYDKFQVLFDLVKQQTLNVSLRTFHYVFRVFNQFIRIGSRNVTKGTYIQIDSQINFKR